MSSDVWGREKIKHDIRRQCAAHRERSTKVPIRAARRPRGPPSAAAREATAMRSQSIRRGSRPPRPAVPATTTWQSEPITVVREPLKPLSANRPGNRSARCSVRPSASSTRSSWTRRVRILTSLPSNMISRVALEPRADSSMSRTCVWSTNIGIVRQDSEHNHPPRLATNTPANPSTTTRTTPRRTIAPFANSKRGQRAAEPIV